MAYVYKHIRNDTKEVFYIGISNDTNYARSISYDSRNQYWLNVVAKCGFTSLIIEDNLNWEEACERERYWIKFYGRKDLKEGSLVNMTDGGDGNNGYLVTDGLRKIRSLNQIGEKNVMYGKHHSAEVINKLKLRVGENNPFFGKKHSEEYKLKMKYNNPSSKMVDDDLIKSLNSKGLSVTEIHNQTGITKRIIHNRLKRYGLPHNAPTRYLKKK
jgi:hypothetical protein